MPPGIDSVRVNDLVLTYASFSFELEGVPFTGIKSLKYSEKRERPVSYGAKRNGTPYGKGAGKYSVDSCSMVWSRDSWEFATDQLTILGLGSFGDASFSWTAQYSEPIGGLLRPVTVIGLGCTIDGVEDDTDEGTDELVTNVTIGCMGIIKNGKTLWSQFRSFL